VRFVKSAAVIVLLPAEGLLWFGARVAAEARGHFRLICEGWVPHGGLCDVPGPRSSIERANRGWCS